mmetsp:Transcript_43854/g.118315  ORF Transcript_43854/g.118315 Transcript_43854/m.118315 type:complete len:260 (-) Transcript_43854:65-844(-)
MRWPLVSIRMRVGSIIAYAIMAVAFEAYCVGALASELLLSRSAYDGQEDPQPAVDLPLPPGDRPLDSSLSLLDMEEPAATQASKRRSLLVPAHRSTVPPVEKPAKGTAGLQAAALHAEHHRVGLVQPLQPGNRTKSGQPAGSKTFWKTLMVKAENGANMKAEGVDKQSGNDEQSGFPHPAMEVSSGRGRRKQLTAIIAAVVVVVLLGTCAMGMRMRTRARGPLAGDAKIQKEFSEHQGPPAHLRVRHWLTGDGNQNQWK